MSRILVATQSATAHVSPFATAVKALVAHGHEVFWYTGQAHAAQVAASGATFAAPENGTLPDFENLERDYPQMITMTDAARAAWFVEEIFVAPSGGQYRDLAALASGLGADLIMADSTMLAAGLLHELDGILWATLSVAPVIGVLL